MEHRKSTQGPGRPGTSMLFAMILFLAASGVSYGQTAALTVLYTFTGGTNGSHPSGVFRDASGNFYGTTVEGGEPCSLFGDSCGGVFKLSSATGVESFLHVFSVRSEGSDVQAGVIQDIKGNLYGVTVAGGNSSNSGVVYQVDQAGAETVLHTFDQVQKPEEGWGPLDNLVRDAAGNLYGTTPEGGLPGGCAPTVDCGLVFELDSSGSYTVLHPFAGAPADGEMPNGALVRDAAGNLYGTTFYGGPATGVNYGLGAGTVFKIDPNGIETIVYNFNGVTDGGSPISGVIVDRAGNLYGIAQDNGEGGGVYNNGVVFKLDMAGYFTVLYAFTGGADGGSPAGPLVLIEETGGLYGTASYGGIASGTCGNIKGCGVVFKVDSVSGKETVLYRFTGLADGGEPITGLIASKGANGSSYDLFGTTLSGGDSAACSNTGCGTIFQLTVSR